MKIEREMKVRLVKSEQRIHDRVWSVAHLNSVSHAPVEVGIELQITDAPHGPNAPPIGTVIRMTLEWEDSTMSEPKLEIVETFVKEVGQDIESESLPDGSLILLRTDLPWQIIIPADAVPALRKHLNEGMVERWAIPDEIDSEFTTYWIRPEKVAGAVRILVPAEPSND